MVSSSMVVQSVLTNLSPSLRVKVVVVDSVVIVVVAADLAVIAVIVAVLVAVAVDLAAVVAVLVEAEEVVAVLAVVMIAVRAKRAGKVKPRKSGAFFFP
jgi:hypothetical protein